MSTVSAKISTGIAACGIAAAAVLTPGVANAAPFPQSAVGGIGGAVTLTSTCPDGTNDCLNSATPGDNVAAVAPSQTNIFQNGLWWFGPSNPTPPPQTTVFEFYPVTLIPGFLQPIYGWFTQNINFEACILGATLQIGPYGTVRGSYSQGCA